MSKFASGVYYPVNKEKYIGNKFPTYRSSWELTMMRTFDNHSSILEWASEPVKIPYINPSYNQATVYVPDFLIRYIDKNQRIRVELIEVKPKSQTFLEHAKTKKDKASLIVNAAKWEAANRWAKKRNIRFRVVNEHHIFGE